MLNLLMYFYQVVIQEDEKMKKALSVLLTMGLTVSMLAGCGSNGAADNASAGNAADNSAADNTVAATESSAAAGEAKSASDIKVGVIYIGDENEGYTAAHMAGIDQMMSNLGLSEDQVVEKTLILFAKIFACHFKTDPVAFRVSVSHRLDLLIGQPV